MTLDSSALVAVLFSEPGYLDLVDEMLQAPVLRIGAPTLVETGIVLAARRGAESDHELAELLRELDVTVVPFGADEWRLALDAYRRYGRGRHKAALNFGDCLAYASAVSAGDALLYVGRDFARTDVPSAR